MARPILTFSDLMRLPFEAHSGLIDLEAILAALPKTPRPVATQFYADHARNSGHQAIYGSLRVDMLDWALVGASAGQLITASTVQEFRPWFDNVGNRAGAFHRAGWQCIDSRQEVRAQWERHGTWLVPPIVLAGNIVGSSSEFHVAEGHTRIGLLKGLTEAGVLSPLSMHEVWVGQLSTSMGEGK